MRASHCCGLSPCGAQAPDVQAQQPWIMGPAAPQHVGSSWTRARTRVPCIGRRTLNHCATREAPRPFFNWIVCFFRYAGLSLLWPLPCGAQAPDVQAQQPWLTGPAAPRHMGSSRTGARTHVPCIGRRTLNHCTTREAPDLSCADLLLTEILAGPLLLE